MDDRVDTRRALVGGAAAGSLLLLLGRARPARAQLDEDRGVLSGLVDLEAQALELYESATRGAGLAAEAGTTIRRFAEQQREHVATLAAALGSRPSAPVIDLPQGRQAVLERAVALEDELVAAYFDAHQRLVDSALVTLGAGIMANHGQRLVALRDLLGEDVLVPDAFATGA